MEWEFGASFAGAIIKEHSSYMNQYLP